MALIGGAAPRGYFTEWGGGAVESYYDGVLEYSREGTPYFYNTAVKAVTYIPAFITLFIHYP